MYNTRACGHQSAGRQFSTFFYSMIIIRHYSLLEYAQFYPESEYEQTFKKKICFDIFLNDSNLLEISFTIEVCLIVKNYDNGASQISMFFKIYIIVGM